MRAEVHEALAKSELPPPIKHAIRVEMDTPFWKQASAEKRAEEAARLVAEAEAAYAAHLAHPVTQQLAALEAAFFGTLAARDPAEGVDRPKRLHDGWRHGVSHPVTIDGKSYDVIAPTDPADQHDVGYASEATRKQYDRLRARIEASQ